MPGLVLDPEDKKMNVTVLCSNDFQFSERCRL